MSTDTNTPAAAPDTANATPVAAPVVAAPPVAQPPIAEPAKTGAKVEMTSDELKRRLDETRSKTREEARLEFLKSFGVSDEAALKTAIAEQKRLEDEKRTDLEKRDALIKSLEPKAQRADELLTIVKTMAEEQEAALTDAQRKFVSDFGGDDPAARLKAIKALRDVLPAAPIAPAVQNAAAPATQQKPPIQPGANTAPPPAPSPSGVVSPHVDHLATWDALKARNDGGYSAAQYYNRNMAAIIAAQKARS
jgi:hypothetical protein